ncbi:zinc/manganese transport system substrate-binding protein [Abditibacterium utsteinense]|uniref:Zinc/manganese transport system substrate-binding protein n=1 Tax=Abditibacterium utsteinense TaxID=1960156 RepID=A0A2S8SRZ8_9BACT|nr:metal ABC transporter substrate-binding protein [Abditibacterium utsteinense]PQV63565.1 zinc/manganese transport system substrate-binding protein [Abditibacterium utsteinense]
MKLFSSRHFATIFSLCGALLVAKSASAATEVVASLPELAAIAKAVGGDGVTVYSIAKPNQDYHSVEPRPSDVARISRADLVIRSGLSLDMWMDSLMNAAGNGNLNRGGRGYVDASAGIPTIEKPSESISGASGDVHPEGNPHYLYDPIYAKRSAQNIVRGLIRVDAKNAASYRANYLAFNRTIDQKMVGWRATLSPYTGRSIVTYHRIYNYFLRRFGLRQYGTLEPKPGIPPSAAHISQLISQMKRDNVKGILVENIYPRRFADLMGRQLGVTPQFGPVSVQSYSGAGYFALIDTLIARTKAAID